MSNDLTATNPTVVFVLGLLGLLACQICGPIAWVMGNRYLAECRELGIQPDGMGSAGRVLGIVSTVFLILGLVFLVLYIALVVVLVGAGVALDS